MDNFPLLQDNQVVLILAQHSTGIVLNMDLQRADFSAAPKIYRIFDNIDKAREYIDSKINLVADTEFVVYDKNQDVVLYVAPPGSYYSENSPPFVK